MHLSSIPASRWFCRVAVVSLCLFSQILPPIAWADGEVNGYVELTAESQALIADLPEDLRGFIQGTLDVLESRGSHAVVLDYWDQLITSGELKTAALRKAVLESNGGQPVRVSLKLHKDHAPTVDFLNDQLRRAHLEFVQFDFVEDNTQKAPEIPFQPDARAFKLVTRAGALVLPIIAAAMAGSESLPAIQHAIHTGALSELGAPVAVRGMTKTLLVLGLETQFRIFAEMYGTKWGDPRPGLHQFSQSTIDRLKGLLGKAAAGCNALTGYLNRLGLNKLPRGVYNISTANIIYGGLMVASALIASGATGDWRYLSQQNVGELFFIAILWGGLRFTSAIAPFQALFAKWRNRMAITPFARTLSDLWAVTVNSAGRGLSISYQKDSLGTWFNFGFLALFGVPMLAMDQGIRANADRLGRIVDRGEGKTVEEPTGPLAVCNRALAFYARRLSPLPDRQPIANSFRNARRVVWEFVTSPGDKLRLLFQGS